MPRGVPAWSGNLRNEQIDKRIRERTAPIVTYYCGCPRSVKRVVAAPKDGLVSTTLICSFCDNIVKPSFSYPVDW